MAVKHWPHLIISVLISPFLGAASITEDGFYTFENEDAAIKHLIAKNSTLTCVLADSGKFLLQPAYKFGKLSDVDIVLTTKNATKSHSYSIS